MGKLLIGLAWVGMIMITMVQQDTRALPDIAYYLFIGICFFLAIGGKMLDNQE